MQETAEEDIENATERTLDQSKGKQKYKTDENYLCRNVRTLYGLRTFTLAEKS
jgi:hypothetical protein